MKYRYAFLSRCCILAGIPLGSVSKRNPGVWISQPPNSLLQALPSGMGRGSSSGCPREAGSVPPTLQRAGAGEGPGIVTCVGRGPAIGSPAQGGAPPPPGPDRHPPAGGRRHRRSPLRSGNRPAPGVLVALSPVARGAG